MNELSMIFSALIDDPIKTAGAIASTGAMIIGWKNFKKDSTKVNVVVKRAQNGPLALQHPDNEYLLFEVYNQGISPVVINEIGIRVSEIIWINHKFINLVDLAYSTIKDPKKSIGSIECIELPGTIPGRATGIFLLDYSGMRNSFLHLQKRKLSSDSLGFGNQRLIKAFHEFQRHQTREETHLQIIPYVFTGSGEIFIGSKSLIKLGDLGSFFYEKPNNRLTQ
jgi:hypothetical protein